MVSIDPVADATGVDPAKVITIHFSAALDPATVSATSVHLTQGTRSVGVALGLTADTLVITPSDLMGLLAQYTVRLDTSIQGTGGTPLSGTRVFSFTTREVAFDVADTVATGLSSQGYLRVSVASTGYEDLTFIASQGSFPEPFAFHYTSSGWNGGALAPGVHSVATWSDIVTGSDGSACAVFYQYDYLNVVTRQDGQSAWSVVQSLGQGYGRTGVALRSVGRCVAAGVVNVGTAGVMTGVVALEVSQTNYTDKSSRTISTSTEGPVMGPIASAPSLQIYVAIWAATNGSLSQVRAYASDGTSATGDSISDPAASATDPSVAMDANGNAVAAWRQMGASSVDAYASRRPRAGAWSTPTKISDGAASVDNLDIKEDRRGNFAAIWQEVAGSINQIYVSRMGSDGSWSAPTRLTDGTSDATTPQIAFDAAGNAFATFRQVSGTRGDIWLARYTSIDGSWAPPAVRSDRESDATIPQVGLDDRGRGAVIWFENSSVIAQRFE